MPQQNAPENFSVTTIITFIKYLYAASDFLRYTAPVNDQTLPYENLRNSSITINGDGMTERDYTFFSDIIDGVISVLDKQIVFEIINLGDSKPIELKKLINLIEQELGKKAQIKRLPEQPGDVHRTYADIGKAERFLQYQPKVPIEQGIRLFVTWYNERKKQTA